MSKIQLYNFTLLLYDFKKRMAFACDILRFIDGLLKEGSIRTKNYEKIMYKNAANLLSLANFD